MFTLTSNPIIILTFQQAVNNEGGEVNIAFDHDHASRESETDTIPNVATRLKARNQPWALIVDDNYGEGSAREHAALQPRFYGCAAIVARSFARIHETNLKVCSLAECRMQLCNLTIGAETRHFAPLVRRQG